MGVVFTVCRSIGSEYEVKGKIVQTTFESNAHVVNSTNDFTVFVRDCGWLIQTVASDAKGHVLQREMGTTNGADIYDFHGNVGLINGRGIPVELADQGVDGHLWMMFASQCYWSSVQTDLLTPVYSWQASVGANPEIKVKAGWDLLGGPGTLPREVRYYGDWDETNGFYKVSGTKTIAGVQIPTGFTFEERYIGGRVANSLVHGMYLRKRVEAVVTSVQPVCSRKNLLPVMGTGKKTIIDWRLKNPAYGNQTPSYILQNTESWPSVADANKIIQSVHERMLLSRNLKNNQPMFVRIVMAVFIIIPPLIYFAWHRLSKP